MPTHFAVSSVSSRLDNRRVYGKYVGKIYLEAGEWVIDLIYKPTKAERQNIERQFLSHPMVIVKYENDHALPAVDIYKPISDALPNEEP